MLRQPTPASTRSAARPESTAQIPAGSIAYTRAGHGPVVLLIHGLGGTRATWNPVIEELARTHTVIAPDLPGHGQSDPPAGDYSLGAHASALRDLLVALRLPPATVIGHSLGGGVAMQTAYQFPERVQRLVLISSGGLGTEVTPILRFASSSPGAGAVLTALAALPGVVLTTVLSLASVLPGGTPRTDTGSLVAGVKRLRDPRQRRAFIRTARSVIDWRGQSVSAIRHLRTFVDMPVLLVWGGRDRTIPPHHHAIVADALARSRTLELPDAGHFPHETDPVATCLAVQQFIRDTEPYRFDEDVWRRAFPGAIRSSELAG